MLKIWIFVYYNMDKMSPSVEQFEEKGLPVKVGDVLINEISKYLGIERRFFEVFDPNTLGYLGRPNSLTRKIWTFFWR